MADCKISEATRAEMRQAWPDIIDALAGGAEVRAVLAAHGLTRGKLAAFMATEANARDQWETAKEVSAEEFFDQLIAMANNRAADVEPARARAVMDLLKWLAAKRNPRAYSDKAQLDINVKTVDLTRIISEANARLAAGRQGRIIEHMPGDAIEQSASKLLELL